MKKVNNKKVANKISKPKVKNVKREKIQKKKEFQIDREKNVKRIMDRDFTELVEIIQTMPGIGFSSIKSWMEDLPDEMYLWALLKYGVDGRVFDEYNGGYSYSEEMDYLDELRYDKKSGKRKPAQQY